MPFVPNWIIPVDALAAARAGSAAGDAQAQLGLSREQLAQSAEQHAAELALQRDDMMARVQEQGRVLQARQQQQSAADALRQQRFPHLIRIGDRFFTDGENRHLHRCEPERKCAGEMFNQDAEESFNGPKDRAVQHDRSFQRSVLIHIFELEFFWKGHVELDGAALPRPSDGVADMDVDLRSVESAVAFIDDEGLAPFF